MVVPAFLIKLAQSLGLYAAEKAFDVTVDTALEYKENKRNKAQLNDIQETVHETNTLLQGLVNESSQAIRAAVAQLKPLIETLHVVTAHQVLDNLRATIKAEDRKTLSRIDYYRACCSRYINKDQCISEYNLAWQEMIDDGGYDPEIVAGKIYVHCLNRDKDAAKLAADRLKSISRSNVWAWVPDLLFSEDLEKAYLALSDDIDKLLVLANTCSFGNLKNTLGVDLDTYEVQIPENLTYDNIPLWSFNISVLLNRFIPEWNVNAPKQEVGDATKALFEASGTLMELEKRTQLSTIFNELAFWNAFSGCQINPTSELMETLRTASCQQNFEEYRVVAYVICLANMGAEHDDEAKEYLNTTIITPATLNQRFLLSLKTMDAVYADETFKMAAKTQVIFPEQVIVYALSAIKNFKEQVKDNAPQLKVETELDAKAYQQICNHFFGEGKDITLIQEIKDKVSRTYRPFLAIVLHDSGHIEEGTDLMRSVVRTEHVELVSHMYADMLASNRCHFEEYFKFLRHVREDLGYTDNPIWLQNEYSIASQLPDIESMVATSTILHQRYPEQKNFYIASLCSLTRANELEKVKELAEELNNYDFSPENTIFVYRQFVLSGLFEIAVEFLYQQVQQKPTNEGLNMEFHRASMVAATAKIISKEYDEVFDGAYVQYKHNGQQKSTIVDASNRDAFLIGLKKGESTEQKDWRGNPETYEVISIHNKYHQLVERIYQDIGENKFNSIHAFQFTDEEMQGGNIINLLQDITGHDSDWQSKQRERERKYKESEYPFSIFLNENSLLDDIYNHMFGDFKYYNYPKNLFVQLYEDEQVSILGLQPVYDLPSVILAFELHLKFNLDFGKFIVPDSLVKVVECFIQWEQYGMASGIYQSVADLLVPLDIIEGDGWSVTRFKALLSWIKENAEIIQVTERLNQNHDELFKESSYITVFYDCLSLVMKGKRVLISGDMALMKLFVNRCPVADVSYLVSVKFPAQYSEVCQFFMQSNIYGAPLDADYVLAEYTKHSSGKSSAFNQCKENFSYSKYLFQVVFSVCQGIMEAPIVSGADELVVEELLSDTFGSVNRSIAYMILQTFMLQTRSGHFRRIMVSVFKSVYPLS